MTEVHGTVATIATDVDEVAKPYFVLLEITPTNTHVIHEFRLTRAQLVDHIDDLKDTLRLLD